MLRAPIKLAVLLLAALPLAALPARAAEAEAVDVALVLAVDISLSMDESEQRAQRDGYVAALEHPAVLDAIARGRRGRIAVTYLEWGGPSRQRIVAPWTVIAGPDDARAFADIVALSGLQTSRGTSITAALDFARGLLDHAPPADRRVIDVSGDGPNNMGGGVEAARDRALAQGIEINGLPLMLRAPDLLFSIPELDIYYEECVIGGPSAFMIPVLDVRGFAAAIRQKLVLEIAGRAPPGRPDRDAPRDSPRHAAARIDCFIGEKLYERWRRQMDWN